MYILYLFTVCTLHLKTLTSFFSEKNENEIGKEGEWGCGWALSFSQFSTFYISPSPFVTLSIQSRN